LPVYPGNPEAFVRFDALGSRVLHADKHDAATARRLQTLVQRPKAAADAKMPDLRLKQPLARLRQAFLHLADAQC